MALKAVHVSNVPNLDQVSQTPSISIYKSTPIPNPSDGDKKKLFPEKLAVIGHRGSGMNMLQSSGHRMNAIKENSILSFNHASKFSLAFIEFDVQVTTDDCPIIFHDDVILSEEDGTIYEKRVADLSLSEFLGYGPQRETGTVGKCLFRKTSDGKILKWDVEKDDFLCTLEETFQKVDTSLGFNIELKFDDHVVYQQHSLVNSLEAVLKVVYEHGKDRPILFSTFQPDAAILMKKLQSTYPVFFLTDGGSEIYNDTRRNSLDEALKLCIEGGLDGIVSEVGGIFRNPSAVPKIKEAKLSLLTYGKLNNVPEAVYLQHFMGVEGVIVDLVQEISEAVSAVIKRHHETKITIVLGTNTWPQKTKFCYKINNLSKVVIWESVSNLYQQNQLDKYIIEEVGEVTCSMISDERKTRQHCQKSKHQSGEYWGRKCYRL